MKKSIFLFFAAILCATSAWAADLTANYYIYFEKPSDWSNVSFLIGHNTYSIGYNMTKISNTNLYYWKTESWGGYTQYAFIDAKDWGGEGNGDSSKPANRKKWANHSTNTFTTAIKKYHLFTTAGSKSSDASDRKKAINRTQTIKVQVKDGENWVDATVVPADLTASTYAMTSSSTSVSAASASLEKESATVSTTVDAAYSATVTLSCENTINGYVFEGWYNEGGTKITSYTVSAATTIYARFIQSAEETNLVTISYKCGSTDVVTSITEQVGVETEKTFTAPTVTGYNFTGWTVGAGMTLKAGTANDATITVVTKSSSSNYTLVANYEEVLETVYFINAGNWADVHIHLWNGTATGTEWPGTQLTATGTKIGEYDVYEYTAQQGAHVNLLFHKKDNDSQKTADLTWTAGKYYIHNHNGKTGWYTQAEAEEILVVPVVEETVYFVNNKNWTKVQVHAWKDAANNGWPGQALTATGEKVAGFDVYSFTAPQGTYTNLLFNNKEGDAGVQSNNFVWTADKYYYMDAAADYAGGTKEEVAVLVAPDPLATGVYLAGDMTNKDNWDVNKKEFKKETAEAKTASVTVTLAAQTYKFKLVVGGAWKGNTGTMQRGGDAVHEGGWSFDKDGYDDNCQIVADIAGDYTFTWNLTDKKLTVAYPPLPKHQVNATVNPAETGTVTGMGEYEQGSTATLVAAPAANYAFKNWTEGGEVVSTEATYSFKVTKAVELVANFVPEETHEVTVSYICNSNPIPGHAATTLAVGVTTPSTITAPAITNYTFDRWTLGTGIQTEDDATDNPIHITAKAEGDYTLTANYTKIELTYTVKVPEGTEKCYIAGDMNSWSFQEMTQTANANEFTITIDGATTVHKYKYACGPDWAYVEKKADGSDLDADRTYSANDVVAKWAEPAKCYLMGIGGDWTTGIEMEEDGDQFKLLCQPIAEGEQFKFKYGDTWTTDVENYDANGVAWVESYPGSGQYNITLPAGNYDFYYKKNENKVWIGVCTPSTPTPDYTRTTTAGKFGTICLPFGGEIEGAELYECVGKETGKVYIASVTTLEAGKPYIFKATAAELAVYSDGTTAPAGNHNGLYGTFNNETVVAAGDYILLNNELRPSDGTAKVNENRAYLVMSKVPEGAPTKMPGRRYVSMSVTGENEATGFENIITTNAPVKVIENGQLIIIRNGEKFNAQGQKL